MCACTRPTASLEGAAGANASASTSAHAGGAGAAGGEGATAPAASASGSAIEAFPDPPSTPPPWVKLNPETEALCPPRMAFVDGVYCPFAGHRCVEWIDEKRDRCGAYAEPPLCEGKKQAKRYCIDRYEYPNLAGVKPSIMMNWFEAKAACEIEGKRLCTSSEWTLACEGEEILPHPYGYRRDTEACNLDRPRPTPEPDFEAFSHPRLVGAEVARLDLRVASGTKPRCVSPYGAYDMTGNVDEWVVNEKHFEPPSPGHERPFISGLKGGYWGPIRARCRPITSAHNEWFRFYQVGFRCCADPKGTAPAPERKRLPRAPKPKLGRAKKADGRAGRGGLSCATCGKNARRSTCRTRRRQGCSVARPSLTCSSTASIAS